MLFQQLGHGIGALRSFQYSLRFKEDSNVSHYIRGQMSQTKRHAGCSGNGVEVDLYTTVH